MADNILTDIVPADLKCVACPHGNVKLNFQKLGHPGICIESQRENDKSMTILASPHRSPYFDLRANQVIGASEVRKYQYRYLNADGTPGGACSAVLEITTEP